MHLVKLSAKSKQQQNRKENLWTNFLSWLLCIIRFSVHWTVQINCLYSRKFQPSSFICRAWTCTRVDMTALCQFGRELGKVMEEIASR